MSNKLVLQQICDSINNTIHDGGHWMDPVNEGIRKHGVTKDEILNMYQEVNGATPEQITRDFEEDQ